MPLKTDGSSYLCNTDPYHIPGYNGYCPQIKYRCGRSFASTTSDLLHSPTVGSSGKLVLSKIELDTTVYPEKVLAAEALKRRQFSTGDAKLVEQVMPGYTGYIPCSQRYFGSRYSDICLKGIADFEVETFRHATKMEELKKITSSANAKPGLTKSASESAGESKYILNLQPIYPEAAPYPEKNFFEPESPYFMAINNPKKHFLPGYQGYIPRAQWELGQRFTNITKRALNRFTEENSKHNSLKNKPIVVEKCESTTVDKNLLYPIKRGIIPRFAGHVPGQQFRNGQTFGESTINVKQCMHQQKLIEA